MLVVFASAAVDVTDDGAALSGFGGGIEWGEDWWTRCPACDHEDIWHAFGASPTVWRTL